MIIIDWISAPDHRNFNRALFSALGLKNSRCVVFSDNLLIPEVEGELLPGGASRMKRVLEIISLLIKYRKSKVFFITYDMAFLPFVMLFRKDILVWEHNTTPEKHEFFKGLWQRILYRGIIRLAQFPGQEKRLLDLKQNVNYIGSPICPFGAENIGNADYQDIPVYIAPSYRANLDDLNYYRSILGDCKIIVKKSPEIISSVDQSLVIPLDWIEFTFLGNVVNGILMTVKSEIRGSFWLNEAIANKVPIIICNEFARNLFEDTFPDYPFIDLTHPENFGRRIDLFSKKEFDIENYIQNHNKAVSERFFSACEFTSR